MIYFNPFEFSFSFKNWVLGYDREDGFIFGKISYFERLIAEEVANNLNGCE